jgi:hypothetical protein
MSEDNIPKFPSPSMRLQFRRAGKSLCNVETKSGATSGSTKSFAQVETLVLPQPKSGGLKPGSTKKPRTTPFAVRVTQQQKEIIKAKAKAANRNVNEYMGITINLIFAH